MSNLEQDVTELLNLLAESVRELNSVNFDILRIINDDWSKLSETDGQFLTASMKMAEQLMNNDRISNLEGKQFSGDAEEIIRLLGELKNYILQLKLRRTLYELKNNTREPDPNIETYGERQAKIQASRKKHRDKRKKKK